MSGLATYFSEFLPCEEVPDYNETLFQDEEEDFASVEAFRMTLSEWRNSNKRSISNYFHRRIAANEDFEQDEAYDSDGSVSDNDSTSSSESEDEDRLETQQPVVPFIPPTSEEKRKHQRRIPHIDQTFHQVNKLEFIDMFTSTVNIDVCQVTRVWRMRDTKRGLAEHKEDKEKCLIFPGRLPRVAFRHRQEDGPLSPIYQQVVSLELEVGNHRLLLFLYNHYAKYFDKWHTSLKKGTKLVLRLKQIPAICIVPYALDPRNFVDLENLAKYCLCIGGDGSMKMQHPNNAEPPKRVRLDAPDLELRFLQVTENTDETALELVLSPQTMSQESPFRQYGTLHQSSPAAKAAKAAKEAAVCQSRQKEPRPAIAAAMAGTVRPRPVTLPDTLPPVGNMTVEGSASKRRKSSNRIAYITLSELREVLAQQEKNQKLALNIYAAVLGFTCARQSKRGDWMMTVTLVDETCNSLPVTLIMFCADQKHLPQLSKMGDILRIHKVHVTEWKGDVQLTGLNKSSYVVIRKPQHEDFKLLPTTPTAFDFTSKDEETSQRLWHWAQHFIQLYPTMKEQHSFRISDIPSSSSDNAENCDLTVMVTAMFPNPSSSQVGQPCGFLRVWDGTGNGENDILPIDSARAKNSQRQGDPPPACLLRIRDIVRQEKLETPKAVCGKVINVLIWEASYWKFALQNVKVGSFLRLRNVHARSWLNTPFVSIMVHDLSYVIPLPDQSFEISALFKMHGERMKRNEYNPGSGLLPLSSTVPQHRVNLSEGHGLKEFHRDGKQESFVGCVTVGNIFPEFDSALGPYCTPCGDSFVYQFAVTLFDRSGNLDVIVSNDAGTKLIGIPASMAVGTSRKQNRQLVKESQKWMAKVVRCQDDQSEYQDEYLVLVDISEM